MSRPARQAREAGTAQELFQRQRTQHKKAKHPNRPSGATNPSRRSGTGGGAGSRRLSGPGERTRRKHECADERSVAAVRRAGRRTGHEEQGPAPPPGTRQKNQAAPQTTQHASEEPSSATNYPARVRRTKQRHKTTQHASEEPSSATNYPARVKETKQRRKPPGTRQRNQAAPQTTRHASEKQKRRTHESPAHGYGMNNAAGTHWQTAYSVMLPRSEPLFPVAAENTQQHQQIRKNVVQIQINRQRRRHIIRFTAIDDALQIHQQQGRENRDRHH